jgi:hypothetical protein
VREAGGWSRGPQIHSLNPFYAISGFEFNPDQVKGADRYPNTSATILTILEDMVIEPGMTFAFEPGCGFGNLSSFKSIPQSKELLYLPVDYTRLSVIQVSFFGFSYLPIYYTIPFLSSLTYLPIYYYNNPFSPTDLVLLSLYMMVIVSHKERLGERV